MPANSNVNSKETSLIHQQTIRGSSQVLNITFNQNQKLSNFSSRAKLWIWVWELNFDWISCLTSSTLSPISKTPSPSLSPCLFFFFSLTHRWKKIPFLFRKVIIYVRIEREVGGKRKKNFSSFNSTTGKTLSNQERLNMIKISFSLSPSSCVCLV